MNDMYFQGLPQSGSQSWQSPAGYNYQQMNSGSPVCKVASLEEAIFKSNLRPSENLFFHQTKPEFYNVRVDLNGNKTWQTFNYHVANTQVVEENVGSISKADFDSLVERVRILEAAKVGEANA